MAEKSIGFGVRMCVRVVLPLPQQCRLVHCLKPQRVQTGSGKCHRSSTFLPLPGKHDLSPAEGVWSVQVPSACGVQEHNSSLIQQHGKTVKSSEVSPNSDCIRPHGARSRLFCFLGGGGSLYNAMQFTLCMSSSVLGVTRFDGPTF